MLAKNESFTISVWNQRKVHKGKGAGFLGCVKVTPRAIDKLKGQGCKCFYYLKKAFLCQDLHIACI